MTISEKSIKLLWANAAGRCSFEGCNRLLCLKDTCNHLPYHIGEMAHICGRKPGSNRYTPNLTLECLDEYNNLILLCPTHHTFIDKKENEECYSVENLLRMKKDHESFVINTLEKNTTIDLNEIVKKSNYSPPPI